jgi:hypothetical protein
MPGTNKLRGEKMAKCWTKGGSNDGGGLKYRDWKLDGKERRGSKSQAAATDKCEPDIEAWATSEVLEDLIPQMSVTGTQDSLYRLGASRQHRKYFVA